MHHLKTHDVSTVCGQSKNGLQQTSGKGIEAAIGEPFSVFCDPLTGVLLLGHHRVGQYLQRYEPRTRELVCSSVHCQCYFCCSIAVFCAELQMRLASYTRLHPWSRS